MVEQTLSPWRLTLEGIRYGRREYSEKFSLKRGRKIGVAIDLVHLRISFAHALTRFVGCLMEPLPVQILGGGPSRLTRHDRRP